MKASIQYWANLAREAFLILGFAYLFLIGGGFSGMVDFRLQAFTTILATLTIGIWLTVRLIKKKSIATAGIELAALVFLVAQFLTVAFSEDPRRSLPHAVQWLVYFLVFFLVLDLLRNGWPQELLVRCMLLASSILLAFSLFDLGNLYTQWRTLAAGLEFVPSFQHRLSTLLGDPNLLAAFTNLLLPMAIVSLLAARSFALRIALGVYVAASLVVVYFSDSRGGLLGLGAGLALLAVLWVALVSQKARNRAHQMWVWLWTHRVVLLLLCLGFLAALGFVGWRFLSFQGDTTHAPVAESREIYWTAAINAVKADPLTGAGPGMYPIYLMKIWSTPPARPYLHAHSFPFQIAAESGIFGLSALLFLVSAIVWRAWKVIGRLDVSKRVWCVGAAAGLIGLSVHSLVDDFFPFPTVGVTAFILLAFLMVSESKQSKVPGMNPVWFVIPGIAAALFSFYSLNAYRHADYAIALGKQGNWIEAAREMQLAAESDPRLAIYWLQTGYAYGRAAAENVGFLDEATSTYKRGIELEPVYAINRANLAVLLCFAGLDNEAFDQMRIATTNAPKSFQLLANKGMIEEQIGLEEEANSSYNQAINLEPEIANSVFWQDSEIKREVRQNATEHTIFGSTKEEAAALVSQAREYISEQEVDSARSLLEEAYELNDQEVSLYTALAELSFSEGDLDKAEQYIQIALWVQATRNQAKAETILLGAEISYAQGNNEEALRRYQIAYHAILADTSYGWGSAGWSPYAWFVFQRIAFPEDLLPQLERVDIPTEIAERLLQYAVILDDHAQVKEAQSVRDHLEPYLPK